MDLNYEEFVESIMDEISIRREDIDALYKTMDEVNKYGYTTAFLASTEEISIKSALGYGRELGRLEGEIDALTWFLDVLYRQNYKINK